MRITTLGKTGLRVSRVALGTWQLGGDWGAVDVRQAVDAVRYARETGVNIFDTAQGYGFGASEELLGRAIRADLDHRRDEVVIATKGGLRRTGSGLVRDSSPQWLRSGVESSLRALGVEHVDIYQVHWPDRTVPFAETAAALRQLVDEGKIRHVGVSNFDTEQIAELARAVPVETVQPPYHLFRRDVETTVLPYAREHDLGVLVYGPLGHGLLTGALRGDTTFPEDDWRSRSSIFQGEAFRRNLGRVDALRGLAEDRGMTVSQLAVAWTLANPAVDVAIVGSRRQSHVAQSAAASEVHLDAADLASIDRAMTGAVPVSGPTAPERAE